MPKAATIAVIKIAIKKAIKTAIVTAIKKAGWAILKAAIAHLAINALSGRPKRPVTGSELRLVMDSAAPRQLLIGKRATAGSLVAWFTPGIENHYLHLVIALADHKCKALTRIWADGRQVGGNGLEHGVQKTITEYNNAADNYSQRMWMTFWDGRPGQQADPDLIAAGEGAWTTDHRGEGVAYVHVKMWYSNENLNSVPDFLFELEGGDFYDRRKDSTAGGVGAHRLDDPSTWEYTDNVVVGLDHYLLGYKVGIDPLAFGMGLTTDDVPYQTVEHAADLSDELVQTKQGDYIKRFAANGFIGSDQYFEDVIRELETQFAGKVVDHGGQIAIIPAEAKTPVMTLHVDDCLREEATTYADKLSFTDLVGGVEGQYPDPTNKYQPTDYDRVMAATPVDPDFGERKVDSLPFPFETDVRRAVRNARIIVDEAQQQARLAGVFNRNAYILQTGDWFYYTDPRRDMDNVIMKVEDIVKHEDFSATLTAIVVDPDYVAFSIDDDPDLPTPPAIAPVQVYLEETTFTVSATSIDGANTKEPALVITVTGTDDLARELFFELREYDSQADQLIGPTLTAGAHVDSPSITIRQGVKPSTHYKARAKCRVGGSESAWSSWSAAVVSTADYQVGEATSVPWTGVTGAGKPADNATVGATWNTNVFGKPETLGQLDALSANNLTQVLADILLKADKSYVEQVEIGLQGRGLIKNAEFNSVHAGVAIPDGWLAWGGAGGEVVEAAYAAGRALRTSANANEEVGLRQRIEVKPSRQYKIVARVKLESGTLTGAGVYLAGLANLVHVQDTHLNFSNEIPLGETVASNSHDGVLHYELIFTTNSDVDGLDVYMMTKWSGFGAITGVNAIDWLEIDVVPLTGADSQVLIQSTDIAALQTGKLDVIEHNTTVARVSSLEAPNQNLIPNSTGALGLDGWYTAGGNGWQTADGTDVGRYMVVSGDGAVVAQSPRFPVWENNHFALQAQIGGNNYSAGTLDIDWYDVNDAFITTTQWQTHLSNVGYPRLVAAPLAPAGARWARVLVRATLSNGFLIAKQFKAEMGVTHTPWSDDAALSAVGAKAIASETTLQTQQSEIASLQAGKADYTALESFELTMNKRGVGKQMLTHAALLGKEGQHITSIMESIGWDLFTWTNDPDGNWAVGCRYRNDQWAVTEGIAETFEIYQTDDQQGHVYDVYSGGRYPAIPGLRYGASAYLGAHRCDGEVFLIFYDSAGGQLGQGDNENYIEERITRDGEASGGSYLSGYDRAFHFADAPPNTVHVGFVIRKHATKPGQTNSYLFFTRPQLEEVFDGQTEPAPWSPGIEDNQQAYALNTTVASHTTELASIQSGKADLNRVTDLEAKVAIGINLLKNPTGDKGLSNWTNASTAGIYTGDFDTRGRGFLIPVDTTPLTGQFYSDPVWASENTVYSLSGKIDTWGHTGGSFAVAIDCYNSSGGWVGNAGVQSFGADHGGEFHITGQSPAGTASMRVVFTFFNWVSNAAGRSILAYRMKLEYGGVATIWTDDAGNTDLVARVTTAEGAHAALDGRVSAYYGVELEAGTNRLRFVLMAQGGGNPGTKAVLEADDFEMKGNVIRDGGMSLTAFMHANAFNQYLTVPTQTWKDLAVFTAKGNGNYLVIETSGLIYGMRPTGSSDYSGGWSVRIDVDGTPTSSMKSGVVAVYTENSFGFGMLHSKFAVQLPDDDADHTIKVQVYASGASWTHKIQNHVVEVDERLAGPHAFLESAHLETDYAPAGGAPSWVGPKA